MSAKADGTAMMMTKALQVLNKLGLHARPAAAFVNVAKRFQCNIFVQKDQNKTNGKSLIGLLLLAAEHGSTLTVEAHGHDAFEAVAELEALVGSRFGEE
jgi:phosphocarrier protein HPr